MGNRAATIFSFFRTLSVGSLNIFTDCSGRAKERGSLGIDDWFGETDNEPSGYLLHHAL